MSVENVCTHEECTGWCYQRNHVIHGSEKKIDTVEQYGSLFTMDGRRYPDQIPAAILDRIYVPFKFQHLVPKAGVALPEVDVSVMSDLEDLGEPVADATHETIVLSRGIKQHQPKPDRSPQKIGR